MLGQHVQVLPMASIGHDVVLEDFVTVAPSAIISGYVHVGEAAFIGAGAVVVPGRADRPLAIGAGATVAAGAVVTKPVAPGRVVGGNPARPFREIAARRRRP